MRSARRQTMHARKTDGRRQRLERRGGQLRTEYARLSAAAELGFVDEHHRPFADLWSSRFVNDRQRRVASREHHRSSAKRRLTSPIRRSGTVRTRL